MPDLIQKYHLLGPNNTIFCPCLVQPGSRYNWIKLTMSWPPEFLEFDLADERMGLLYGSRASSRNRSNDDRRGSEKDIELGTPQLQNTEEGGHTKSPYHHQEDTRVQLEQPTQNLSRLEAVHLRQPGAPPGVAPALHQQRPARHGCSSFTSSTTTLTAEKQGILDMPLPGKRYDRLTRNLRWTLLSVYRRLNILVLLPNIVVMVVLGAQHNLLRLSPQIVATAIAANLTASVLIRQELLINLLFIIFGNCPKRLPLRVRRLSAKIYHLGGVHSGAGIAAVVWLGLFTNTIVNVPHHILSGHVKVAIWTITYMLDALLLGIVILAHPHIRAKSHNLFEMVHRFAGWSAVGLFWAHFIIFSNAARKVLDPRPSMFEVLIKAPAFWLLIVITLSIIFPWLRLRRVPVHAELLSDHAIRLHFTYTNAPLCSAPRMTDSPLKEWHAFAGIAEEDGNGFSVIVSKAGDWTASIIRNPPTHLWVRGIPTRGVLHVAKIFRKLVLVATGSGIGPILSLLYAQNLDCRILWSTPDPETTYKQSIIDHVHDGDPDAIIINTTVSGRPDLVQRAYDLYKSFDAEAVFIISNPRVTRKFVYALESRGVPTFAPIFDS
jgi:hypothetical protein